MRNSLLRQIIAGLLTLMVGHSAHSVVLDNLYEISLPCESQSDAERQQLFKQGMKEVLARISVEPEPERYPAVARALDKAVDYVALYTYQDNNINIRFHAEAIKPLIQKTGQSLLSQQRPTVIAWLAIEENDERRVIGQESDPILHEKLLKMAQQRGIPLVLPQMDLEDMTAVSISDIWGQFPSVLQQASLRYNAQTILVGRLQRKNEEEWSATWQWISEHQPLSWENQASSLDALLNDGVERTMNQMKAAMVATIPTSQPIVKRSFTEPMLIGIANIRSVEDYVRVETYLEGLDPIARVSVKRVLPDRAVFEIFPRQNQTTQALMQAIKIGQHLTSLDYVDPSFQEVDMAYRWGSLGDVSGW